MSISQQPPVNAAVGVPPDNGLRATTRTWSLPHLYAAKAYLLARFRDAGRDAGERDELERMIAAIRYAIEGWKDVV